MTFPAIFQMSRKQRDMTLVSCLIIVKKENDILKSFQHADGITPSEFFYVVPLILL